MTGDVLALLVLPRRSVAVWLSCLVGRLRHRRRSPPVGVVLLRAGARLLIGVIGGIVLMAARADTHYYQDCWDPDCMMFGCRAYKTGYRDGYDRGWAEGEAAGFAAGMAAGGAS